MPAVWPIRLSPNLGIRKRFSNLVVSFGDGYEQRGSKSQSWTHPDGQGGVTANKGMWEFSITMSAIEQANGDATKEVNVLWQFVIARAGNYEAFYFYNPIERDPPDLTGATTTGRYLVRFGEEVTSLENFMLRLHRGTMTLIEVHA